MRGSELSAGQETQARGQGHRDSHRAAKSNTPKEKNQPSFQTFRNHQSH